MGYLIAAIVTLALLALAVGAYEQNEWDRYAREHCKVIGTISSSTTSAVGIGSNGAVTVSPVYIPGKTGYLCDNNQQVWR